LRGGPGDASPPPCPQTLLPTPCRGGWARRPITDLAAPKIKLKGLGEGERAAYKKALCPLSQLPREIRL
jgi:hypothetical protein